MDICSRKHAMRAPQSTYGTHPYKISIARFDVVGTITMLYVAVAELFKWTACSTISTTVRLNHSPDHMEVYLVQVCHYPK